MPKNQFAKPRKGLLTSVSIARTVKQNVCGDSEVVRKGQYDLTRHHVGVYWKPSEQLFGFLRSNLFLFSVKVALQESCSLLA